MRLSTFCGLRCDLEQIHYMMTLTIMSFCLYWFQIKVLYFEDMTGYWKIGFTDCRYWRLARWQYVEESCSCHFVVSSSRQQVERQIISEWSYLITHYDVYVARYTQFVCANFIYKCCHIWYTIPIVFQSASWEPLRGLSRSHGSLNHQIKIASWSDLSLPPSSVV
jgi:hypothetical protein